VQRATAPAGAGLPKNSRDSAASGPTTPSAQLKAFLRGERGSDPAGKDLNGKINMAGVARGLTDAQMKVVAEYAQGLR
jgi:cytochrome c553